MDTTTLSRQLKNYISYAHVKFTNTSPDAKRKQSYNYRFAPEYLSPKEQDNIYGLYLFMRCNPQVTNEELKKAINDEANQFRTLKSLSREFHVLVDYLRSDGYDKICTAIVKTRKLHTNNV